MENKIQIYNVSIPPHIILSCPGVILRSNVDELNEFKEFMDTELAAQAFQGSLYAVIASSSDIMPEKRNKVLQRWSLSEAIKFAEPDAIVSVSLL